MGQTKGDKACAPIGVFDSGLGGISVLAEMVRRMPGENFLYLGDSAHAPYGTKSLEQVRELTWRSFHYMLEHGAKAVAIACNTATSAAVRRLREEYPDIPLIGIEPALKPAVLQCPGSRIVVMATPMTLRQEKFLSLRALYEEQAEIVSLPCPGLVEFIEQGILDGPELTAYLHEKLDAMRPIGAIVLGCTHYPFVKETIQRVAGEAVAIFDGGEGCARELERRIREKGLENRSGLPGRVEFHNSRETREELLLSQRLFETMIRNRV